MEWFSILFSLEGQDWTGTSRLVDFEPVDLTPLFSMALPDRIQTRFTHPKLKMSQRPDRSELKTSRPSPLYNYRPSSEIYIIRERHEAGLVFCTK